MSSTIHKNKDFVHKRDNYTCYYCGEKFERNELHIDHIIPKSKGGKDILENFVSACIKCNLIKGNLSVSEFIARIRIKYIGAKLELEYLGKILKNEKKIY